MQPTTTYRGNFAFIEDMLCKIRATNDLPKITLADKTEIKKFYFEQLILAAQANIALLDKGAQLLENNHY